MKREHALYLPALDLLCFSEVTKQVKLPGTSNLIMTGDTATKTRYGMFFWFSGHRQNNRSATLWVTPVTEFQSFLRLLTEPEA